MQQMQVLLAVQMVMVQVAVAVQDVGMLPHNFQRVAMQHKA
jgi:hypothetical protein